MGIISAVKVVCGDVNEKANAFLEKHATGIMMAEAAGVAVVSLTGVASATVTGNGAIYAGMSITDLLLLGIGAVGFLVGALMRDFRIVAVGTVLMVLGGVANYIGV